MIFHHIDRFVDIRQERMDDIRGFLRRIRPSPRRNTAFLKQKMGHLCALRPLEKSLTLYQPTISINFDQSFTAPLKRLLSL